MKALIRNLASLLLVAMGTTVHAQFSYTINSDGASITITGYSGPNAVDIPSTINGLTVTDIGRIAFAGTDITSVIIPTGVTNIGVAAFEDCEVLTNAFLPNTLIGIEDQAFDMAGLTTVTIPNSVIDIGDRSFALCPSLTNITFELGLSEIQSNMFGGCDSIGSVIIPASVTNIGSAAFGGCVGLSNIFLQGNAPALGEYAFAIFNPPEFGGIPIQYIASAYYLPGTTGWAEFTSNTFIPADPPYSTNAEFVPAVLWNPTIQGTGTNFGVKNGQYGFDITGTTNLPIAIEACEDPAQSNWTVLQRLTLTNGLFHFREPFDANKPARFYRIGFP